MLFSDDLTGTYVNHCNTHKPRCLMLRSQVKPFQLRFTGNIQQMFRFFSMLNLNFTNLTIENCISKLNSIILRKVSNSFDISNI